jgi:Family of unknown function (DUF6174)
MRPGARILLALTALLAVAALAAACSNGDSPEVSPSPTSATVEPTGQPTTTASTAYHEALNRWTAAAIRDYRFTIQRRCECPDEWSAPTIVTVRDGVAVSATIEGNPAPEGAALTIDDLFTAIGDALNQPVATLVTYDPDLGFPLDVQLDLEAIAVDGGLSLTVSNFERLD